MTNEKLADEKIAKVFIRPAKHCNFLCKHCFNDKNLLQKEFLTLDSAKFFLELLARDFTQIHVRFHGGEPTLAGKNFFREIFDYQKELENQFSVIFINSIQTNGYLLDEEFIQIFKDGNCVIGISFDGNHNEILRPHTAEIYKKIILLKKEKAKFSSICVETQKSVNRLFETYEWFKKEKVHFKFHPVLPRGFARDNSDFCLDIDNYAKKIVDLYRYWLFDTTCNIHVSTFEEFLHIREDKQFKKIWFERNKFALNSDENLYVYGYPNELNYTLGPVRSIKSLKEVFHVPNYRRLQNDIQQLINSNCGKCEVRNICHGVCICSSFLFDGSKSNINYSCDLAKLTFSEILKINYSVESDIKNKNIDMYNPYVKRIIKV